MSTTAFAPVQGTYGPKHFNDIINAPCQFIDEKGVTVETTVHAAAKSAIDCAEALLGRVRVHYKVHDNGQYPEDNRQYQALSELARRINGAVVFLKQDRDKFTPGVGETETRVITTKTDLIGEINELTSTSAAIIANFLTEGKVYWYLPNYLNALKAGYEKA